MQLLWWLDPEKGLHSARTDIDINYTVHSRAKINQYDSCP